MNALSIWMAVRQILPIIEQTVHLAEEMFPEAVGSTKFQFVMQLLEDSYPPTAKEIAEFNSIRPVLVAVINGAVAVYRLTSPIFAKKS